MAFYVPEANANTDPDGYMTNNVEIDNRGYIYIVDRNGAGLDILELQGGARQIGLDKSKRNAASALTIFLRRRRWRWRITTCSRRNLSEQEAASGPPLVMFQQYEVGGCK